MNKPTKKPTDSNISEIEKAKQLIADEQKKQVEEGVNTLNQTLKALDEKGLNVTIRGQFIGNNLKYEFFVSLK